jgi:hypothetical protein
MNSHLIKIEKDTLKYDYEYVYRHYIKEQVIFQTYLSKLCIQIYKKLQCFQHIIIYIMI